MNLESFNAGVDHIIKSAVNWDNISGMPLNGPGGLKQLSAEIQGSQDRMAQIEDAKKQHYFKPSPEVLAQAGKSQGLNESPDQLMARYNSAAKAHGDPVPKENQAPAGPKLTPDDQGQGSHVAMPPKSEQGMQLGMDPRSYPDRQFTPPPAQAAKPQPAPAAPAPSPNPQSTNIVPETANPLDGYIGNPQLGATGQAQGGQMNDLLQYILHLIGLV